MTGIDPHRRVYMQEVAPRDGFQIEQRWIETADKIAFVNALSRTGLAKIEVSSFVSPRAVPHLRDAEEVFLRIDRRPGVVYVALVPNRRGADRAFAARADEINFVMSASETHNHANMRMSCAQSIDALREIVEGARDASVAVNGTVATAFGCPFEGRVSFDRVTGFIDTYLSLGAASITLADTTGMANPRQVADAVDQVRSRFPQVPLTLHFHNTRGMGLANILAAYESGAQRFDGSLGGLGGCPFAPGATGNVCTEDAVHMFDEMGVETGMDLSALLTVARSLPALVGHDIPGQVVKAGRSYDLPRVAP